MTTIKNAYQQGYDIGYSIAQSNIQQYNNLTKENQENFISDMLETELEHYRQFSPFEFDAQEFNESKNPDAIWNSYEAGVYKGILKRVKEYFRNGKDK